MHPEFPDEDIMALFEEKRTHEDIDKWMVCFDGASNALGHGVGAVLVSPDDQCIPFTTRLGFDCTNNMAEYEACALGVQAAIDFDVKLLKVYGDSALYFRRLISFNKVVCRFCRKDPIRFSSPHPSVLQITIYTDSCNLINKY